MTDPIDIVAVQVLQGRVVHLTFSDGSDGSDGWERVVDLAPEVLHGDHDPAR